MGRTRPKRTAMSEYFVKTALIFLGKKNDRLAF